MTATAPLPVLTEDAPVAVQGVGQRQRRRHERRRRVRQQLLVVVLLAVVFGITVAMLATEWLSSGAQHSSIGTRPAHGRSLS
jgi:hypothetical protein